MSHFLINGREIGIDEERGCWTIDDRECRQGVSLKEIVSVCKNLKPVISLRDQATMSQEQYDKAPIWFAKGMK